jgi:hypothetical protein
MMLSAAYEAAAIALTSVDVIICIEMTPKFQSLSPCPCTGGETVEHRPATFYAAPFPGNLLLPHKPLRTRGLIFCAIVGQAVSAHGGHWFRCRYHRPPPPSDPFFLPSPEITGPALGNRCSPNGMDVVFPGNHALCSIRRLQVEIQSLPPPQSSIDAARRLLRQFNRLHGLRADATPPLRQPARPQCLTGFQRYPRSSVWRTDLTDPFCPLN